MIVLRRPLGAGRIAARNYAGLDIALDFHDYTPTYVRLYADMNLENKRDSVKNVNSNDIHKLAFSKIYIFDWRFRSPITAVERNPSGGEEGASGFPIASPASPSADWSAIRGLADSAVGPSTAHMIHLTGTVGTRT